MFRIVDKRPAGQFILRWDEDCDWDSAGDVLVYDEEGFCLNEYEPCGSLPETYWETMIRQL